MTKEEMQILSEMLDQKLEEKLEEKLEKKLEEKLAPIRADISVDLCQYFGQKKSKDYAVFLSSSSSFCCGVK